MAGAIATLMLVSQLQAAGPELPVPGAESAGQRPYADLICAYDWPCEKAYAVMLCESSGNSLAYSAGNIGLFQINSIHRGRVGGDADRLYDPEVNVRIAHDIWSEQGWAPWGCRNA